MTNHSPLSVGQLGLWSLDRRYGDRGAYNLTYAWKLNQPGNAIALREAILDTCKHHSAWQVCFVETETGVHQSPRPEVLPTVRIAALPGLTADTWDLCVREEAALPLDLQVAPLRWTVFTHAEQAVGLMLVVHHIVADAWSVAVALEQVGTRYLQGTSVQAPLDAPTYQDFVKSQAAWLQTAEATEQTAFWSRQLSGASPPALPTDRRRPLHPSFNSGSLSLKIPDRLHGLLESRARERQVRPLVPWLALWFLLLSRYASQNDLVLTMPTAGRGGAFPSVCGYFSNLVALRLQRRDGDTFDGLMLAVSLALEEALRHRELPFPLAAASATHTPEGVAPLTAAGFAWDTYSFLGPQRADLVTSDPQGMEVWKVAGLSLTRVPLKTQRDESDLQLRVVRTPTGAHATFEYSEDLFDRSTIERWSRHFLALAEACANQGAACVDRISLVTPQERAATVDAWNRTEARYPANDLVHTLVSRACRRHPDAIALQDRDRAMNFAELEAVSNQLARQLRGMGVQRGSVVGICIDRSVQMVVATLAAIKAGAAYMPLDPGYPRDRLAYMLADASPVVVIAQTAHAALMAQSFGGPVLSMEPDGPDLSAFSPSALELDGDAEDPLYVIYTSGSTGKPKGARVTHRGFVNLLHWYCGSYGFNPADRFLLVSSFSFDLTQKNIFAPLIAGASLHMPLPGFDGEHLARYIDDAGVTTVNCTPTAFSSLLEFRTRGDFASLRHVFLGGEPLHTGELRHWLSGLPHPRPAIHNTYGPTECTDVVSAFTWDPSAQGDEVPIGKPICNTQLYILDTHGNIAPPGLHGEIHVGGAGLGLGYLNQPAMTAEKFVPNHLGGPSDRLYRTGDVGCYRADGEILYLGRSDRQVKIRGFRIELGEIEEVALRHPDVRQVVVDATVSPRGDAQLACWTVWKHAAGTGELRALLASALPAHMVPTVIMAIPEMPLTPSGKIDRKALPAPQPAPVLEEKEAAANSTEQFLFDIWAQVLGTTSIGRRDSFFALGGNSLSALRVLSMIRKSVVRGECSLRLLFECPTVADLADALEERVVLDIA